jgi:predicted membrane protein
MPSDWNLRRKKIRPMDNPVTPTAPPKPSYTCSDERLNLAIFTFFFAGIMVGSFLTKLIPSSLMVYILAAIALIICVTLVFRLNDRERKASEERVKDMREAFVSRLHKAEESIAIEDTNIPNE